MAKVKNQLMCPSDEWIYSGGPRKAGINILTQAEKMKSF